MQGKPQIFDSDGCFLCLGLVPLIGRWIILWRRLRIFVIGAEEPLWMAVRSDIALPGCPTYPIEASLSVPRFLPYTIVIQAVTLHPVASHSAPINANTTPFDPCTALSVPSKSWHEGRHEGSNNGGAGAWRSWGCSPARIWAKAVPAGRVRP